MSDCPTCGIPPIGSTAVQMEARGTKTPIDAAVCRRCGVVYVPDEEMEHFRERLDDWTRNDNANE